NLSDPLRSLSEEVVNTSGAFVIQQDFDNKYVITNLDFVKRMSGMAENKYGAAELAIDEQATGEISRNIKNILGPEYLVQTRFEQNAGLYSVMRIEKWIIYAILSLILTVAAFNMV